MPEEYLVDGGYASLSDIEDAEKKGVAIYASPNKPRNNARNCYAPMKSDSEEITKWRSRMGTPEAQAIYKSGHLRLSG